MIDYKALAGRIKTLADRYEDSSLADGLREEIADLRTVVSLLEGMAERSHLYSYEAVVGAVARGWCHQKNEHKEMDSDLAMAIANEVMEVLLHPAPQPQPERQPVSEPTYLDPTAVALGLAWSEDGQADSVEPTEYIYIRLKRPEGYEDVHPDLVLEDAHINPAFEAEVVSEPTCKQALQVEPTEAQIEEYEILCNGEWVAGANGPGARAEILHYLTQYEQDGPCEVYAITRRLVDRAALAARDER